MSLEADIDAVASEIRARFGTPYRACQALGLPRGTVYQVLGRRYGGDVAGQLTRLRAALDGRQPESREERAFLAIKAVACARCGARRNVRCSSCDELFRAQARAAAEIFSS